jgi:hypothetical protein
LIQIPLGPKTTVAIAKLQQVAKSAIRMQLKNGWSELDIWAGKRLALTPSPPAPTPA